MSTKKQRRPLGRLVLKSRCRGCCLVGSGLGNGLDVVTGDAEVTQLRAQLGFVPEARGTFRTAKVVADAGGAYARAVLIATGPQTPVARG